MCRIIFQIFFLFFLCFLFHPATAEESSSGFDRVIKTGTIRCGYQYWDGGVMRNEETGNLTGFFVEYAEDLAKAADLKVEWVGPLEWGNIAAELKAHKIDAWCAGTWLAVRNSKFMLVSDPAAYNGFEAFVRADDTRFDEDSSLLDDPSIKMATIDSTSGAQIAKGILPHATPYGLPPLTATDADQLLSVATGKADVTFTSPGVAHRFMQNNPGKVKRLEPGKSYALMGVTIPVGENDFRLLHFFNTGIKELKNTGFTASLIDKYNSEYPGLFVPMEEME